MVMRQTAKIEECAFQIPPHDTLCWGDQADVSRWLASLHFFVFVLPSPEGFQQFVRCETHHVCFNNVSAPVRVFYMLGSKNIQKWGCLSEAAALARLGATAKKCAKDLGLAHKSWGSEVLPLRAACGLHQEVGLSAFAERDHQGHAEEKSAGQEPAKALPGGCNGRLAAWGFWASQQVLWEKEVTMKSWKS